MNWDAIGAIGELVAAAATLATLLYLASQIRQNTRATRAVSFRGISDSMNHVNMAVSQQPELADIWVRGTADREALTPAERHRFDMTLLSYFHVFETMHYEAHAGTGERALVIAEGRSMEALLATPGVRAWWADNPYAFGPEFRAEVDRLAALASVEA